MPEKSLSQFTAAKIGREIAAGKLDPVEVTQFFLDQVAGCEDRAIFLQVTAERALAEAAASRERYRRDAALGPLDGVPIAWKDLFDISGTVTTAGSAFYLNRPAADRDAPVVGHLAAAGMVGLGKTNLSEFAFSGLGINRTFGTPRNPHSGDEPRLPGGSSCGSAVAVARGLAPASIATDTSGSVRIPAAFCGVVGHQTSPGRIDRRGVGVLSKSLDTVGTITRSVEDCMLLDRALRARPPGPTAPLALNSVRAIVPSNYILDDAEAAVARSFETALDRLAASGLTIERPVVEALDRYAATSTEHGTLVTAEAYHLHKSDLDNDVDGRIDGDIAARLAKARGMSAYDLLVIQETRETLSPTVQQLLAGTSIMLMPCSPLTAPAIAPLLDDPDAFARVNLKTIRNSMLANFFGLCSLTLPCGTDESGLPIGLLVCAAPGSDHRLLRLGLSIENSLGQSD